MDESMASHFSYIQQVSAPQELEQLLPRLQAVLAEVSGKRQGWARGSTLAFDMQGTMHPGPMRAKVSKHVGACLGLARRRRKVHLAGQGHGTTLHKLVPVHEPHCAHPPTRRRQT